MRDELAQIHGEIARLIEIRNTLLETIRMTVETRTAEIARQLAGLGERVTAMRFDQIKEIGPFVPRPEIEARFQRLEGLVASQNEKLDDILRHVSGIPARRTLHD